MVLASFLLACGVAVGTDRCRTPVERGTRHSVAGPELWPLPWKRGSWCPSPDLVLQPCGGHEPHKRQTHSSHRHTAWARLGRVRWALRWPAPWTGSPGRLRKGSWTSPGLPALCVPAQCKGGAERVSAEMARRYSSCGVAIKHRVQRCPAPPDPEKLSSLSWGLSALVWRGSNGDASGWLVRAR